MGGICANPVMYEIKYPSNWGGARSLSYLTV
ncbi:hypothetical protein LMG18096_05011 [Ralstonia holmesii]|uniref:Uncharacterized protein n=2 Tax=Ralstonia TaxID=48736 RepID=A0ABC8QQN4_9RALS|nr:hypothetical protein LMG18095_03198 [Ralstonia sp. LMG 18095]CAJ0807830.1 hypothetical protein LMG18096_05011 [Ralstonia sp. LMG 32967]